MMKYHWVLRVTLLRGCPATQLDCQFMLTLVATLLTPRIRNFNFNNMMKIVSFAIAHSQRQRRSRAP